MDSERILLNKNDHTLIDLPELIWEKILSHVKGPDMFNLTLVCQHWNNYITKNRIAITIVRKREGYPELSVIRKSTRPFQHLHLKWYAVDDLELLKGLSSLKLDWKSIRLSSFVMSESLLNYIQEHSNHLTELRLEKDISGFHVAARQTLDLPKLQFLHIDTKKYTVLYFKDLIKLKELNLSLKSFLHLLNKYEMNFNLDKIYLTSDRSHKDKIDWKKLSEFLLTQSSMVHIHVDRYDDSIKDHLWFKLRKLQNISYGKKDSLLMYTKPKLMY
ncbi:unnamed protein product [Diamesa serratosioi]